MFTFPKYDSIKQFIEWGVPQDLDFYCKNGFITTDQYKELTGKDYVASQTSTEN